MAVSLLIVPPTCSALWLFFTEFRDSALRFLASAHKMSDSSSSRSSPSMRVNHSKLLLLGAGLALAVTAGATLRGTSHAGVLAELANARPARVFSPQLSIPLGYRRCTVQPLRAGETVPREACGAESVLPFDLDAFPDSGESSDPDTLRVLALLALTGPNQTERSLDVAISRLSRALRLSSRAVPLLVDLSGAHLVRAQLTQNPRDLLQGLAYATEALGSEPGNPAALFNTALALESLGLDNEGTLAWTAYLRADSASEWAAEARRRRRALQHPPPPSSPGPESSEKEVRAFAAGHPQEARLLGWDTVLGRWGAAIEADRTAEAARLLLLADRLGATLAMRGGDASLADAVGAIRAAADDPAATRVLARAHRRYVAAQKLYQTQDPAAMDSFARVLRARPRSPALVRSAEIFRAGTLVYSGKFAQAESAFADLMPRIDSVRYLALAGRVRWMRGTGLLRNQRYAEARTFYRSAARLFERAGETEYMAANHQMEGEAAYRQRDTLDAYRAMHRGLIALRGFRSSVRLHNTLFVLANAAANDGMPLAAARVQDEDVSVASSLPVESGTLESLLGRASVRIVTGRGREAARDLDRAAARVNSLGTSESRKKLEATVSYLRAMVGTDSVSVARLDSSAAYFTSINDLVLLLPALLRRADVRLERGEVAAATADLDSATAQIRRISQEQRYAYLRAAMMEQARNRFDQLVMLHVRADEAGEALRMVERGRVSFAPKSPITVPPPRELAAPPGQVAVEYALIGDTLLTWTLVGNDVRLRRSTLDRGGFLQMIDRVNEALESPSRAAEAQPYLERLYDLLVRPVKRRLGAAETPLVILADGELAGVPFPALRDTANGRYLVEDHSSRIAATLAEAIHLPPAVDGSARPALLVSDPAFDPEQYLTLDRLGNARAEVNALAALYPANMRLDGVRATRTTFIANAPRAGVIHYAGHAVFDDARPERSALVLAGADTTGRLTAEAVNRLQLRGVRLVVLAACRTLRARGGRSGGFSGFSGALLGAGAGGVVGSLWQVDDSLTQPFMLKFHRAYLHSGDPAAALRQAQLEMLHSGDAALASPAAWGGFRYVGR